MLEPKVGFYDCGSLLQANPADPYALQIQALYLKIDGLSKYVDTLRKELHDHKKEKTHGSG